MISQVTEYGLNINQLIEKVQSGNMSQLNARRFTNYLQIKNK